MFTLSEASSEFIQSTRITFYMVKSGKLLSAGFYSTRRTVHTHAAALKPSIVLHANDVNRCNVAITAQANVYLLLGE